MKKLLTLAACLILTALLNAQTTIFVKPDGTGDGTSWANACNLENAVTNAVSGNEIWMQKGTYAPSKMLIIAPSVKIYGGFAGTETMLSQRLVAANPVIIDGQHRIGSVFRLEKAAELHGLTIQNGNANGNSQKSGGGVWADENCVVANCVITNNTATLNGGGIYAKGKVKIINSTIENNVANGSGNDMFGNCLMMGSEQSGMSSGIDIAGCFDEIINFGTVGFKTQTTVPVTADGITLTWSDAVIAEGCNKTWYNGGNSGNYSSDCRANSNRSTYGDLFSWCAVARFAHVLCPVPWRVPTKEDFSHLDRAMGGNGDGSGPGTGTSATGRYYVSTAVKNNYFNTWNSGLYNGYCKADGTLIDQGLYTFLWGQSEYGADLGSCLAFYSGGTIYPQGHDPKYFGFVLRCVK